MMIKQFLKTYDMGKYIINNRVNYKFFYVLLDNK